MLSVEKRPPATGNGALVVLKDLRHFVLEFRTPEECGDVVDSLEALSHPGRRGLSIILDWVLPRGQARFLISRFLVDCIVASVGFSYSQALFSARNPPKQQARKSMKLNEVVTVHACKGHLSFAACIIFCCIEHLL